MIRDLKPYPAYKDSGGTWLGEVPEHWEIKPLKRWVKMNAAALPETTTRLRVRIHRHRCSEYRRVDPATADAALRNGSFTSTARGSIR